MNITHTANHAGMAAIMALCLITAAPVRAQPADSDAYMAASNTVTATYMEILNRPPDREGFALYIRHLLDGKDDAWLRDVLWDSREAQAMRREAQAVRRRQRARIFQVYIMPLLAAAAAFLICRTAGRPSKTAGAAMIAAASLFPIWYFYLIFKYAVNIPSWDDFPAILFYANQPFPERLRYLFHQHNEHRIATTRILSDLLFFLTGKVDFKNLILLGNAFLIGIFGLLAQQTKSIRHRNACLFLLAAIIFMPAVGWSNMNWAITALSINITHFFALLAAAAFFAGHNPARRMTTFICAAGAAFSSGAGIFVLPGLLITTLLSMIAGAGRRAKNAATADMVFLIIATIVLGALFFTGYRKAAGQSTMLISQPIKTMRFFLIMLGSVSGARNPAQILGGLALLVFAILTGAKACDKAPVPYTICLYLLPSVAAAALFRTALGLNEALAARYQINSSIFLAALICAAWRCLPDRRVNSLVYAGATFLILWHYIGLTFTVAESMRHHREALIAMTANWMSGRPGLHYPNDYAGQILEEALARGVYQPPQAVLEAINPPPIPCNPRAGKHHMETQ